MVTAAPAPAPAPGASERATAVRRALLFLLVGSPVWIAPGLVPVAHPAVLLAVVLGATRLFLRRDGRPPSVLGLEFTWQRGREFAAGFGGGAALVGVAAAGARALLPFPWVLNPQFAAAAAAASLLSLLCGNAVEELVFRGYGFERLVAGVGVWRAQLATALLFAAFHVARGWPWPVALVGTTAGSLLFGAVFLRWRSVPAAVGVHVAANWVRDLVLLDPPAATTLFAPLAPRPWTPGEQVSAGALLSGTALLACAAVWRATPRRRPPALAAASD